MRRREHGVGDEIGRIRHRAVKAARRALRAFEPCSINSLLHAACSSPTARHRLVGCVAMLVSVWSDPPTGRRVARAEDLPTLLATVYEAEPRLGTLEDWMPLDPRLPVLFRGSLGERSWQFPLHPGPIASPVEVPEQALRYAAMLDPVLVDRLGFGVADLIEIAARLLSAERAALAKWWSDAAVSMDSPATVSQAEVDAAAEYLSGWSPELLTADGDPHEVTDGLLHDVTQTREPLARAAAFVTQTGTKLQLTPTWPSTMLGPTMVVQRGTERAPVPGSLVLQGLASAIDILVAAVAMTPQRGARGAGRRRSTPRMRPLFDDADRSAAEQRRRQDARSELYKACAGAEANVMFPVDDDANGGELLLLAPGHRHVVAVVLVGGLIPATLAAGVEIARQRLADLDTRTTLRLPLSTDPTDTAWLGPSNPPAILPVGASLTWSAGLADALPVPPSALAGEPFTLAEGTAVTRLVVVDGPWRPELLWEGGVPVCTLTEFRELMFDEHGASSDWEELWAFLDEIGNLGAGLDGPGHGANALHMFSLLDAWQLWQENGMISPAWLPPQALIPIPPRDYEYAWRRRAALDGVDQLLHAVDLPGVSEWPAIGPHTIGSGDVPEVVTLARRHPRELLFTCPGQQLIVFGELVPVERTPSGRHTTVSLIDAVQVGLRHLATTQPQAWAAWRAAHEDAPTVVRLIPSPGADSGPAVRLAVVAPKQTMLVYRLALLQTTAWSDIQLMIGEELARAVLARLAPPTDEDLDSGLPSNDHDTIAGPSLPNHEPDGAASTLRRVKLSPTPEAQHLADVFMQGWANLPPLVFQQPVPTPFADGILDQPRTLTQAGVDRAARSVARRLTGRLAIGEHPVRLVRDTLCTAALNLLRHEAAAFDSRAVLAAACAELERALADRFLHSQHLRVRLAGPWAHIALADADVTPDSDAARRARAAELLVECLVHDAPTGTLAPDRRDVHRLLQLAAWPLDLALKAQHGFAGIQPSKIDVTQHGTVDLVPTQPPQVDLFGWRQAQWEDGMHSHAEGEPPNHTTEDPPTEQATNQGAPKVNQSEPEDEPDAEAPFSSMRARLMALATVASTLKGRQAAGLLRVDDEIRASWGFGLDAVSAVLSTVAGWPVPDEPVPPIASVRRAELVANIATWSGLPETEIEAAVDSCTLTAQHLRAEGLRYWQLERRQIRLALQPLLVPPAPMSADELWLLPRRAHATMRILRRYLDDGRLPWPKLPDSLQTAVRSMRRTLEAGLEDDVRRVAEEAGLRCRSALLPAKAARQQVHLAGEVDLLAADIHRRRLWVIEAKHLHEPFSPPEMALHIAGFHGHDSLTLDAETLQPHQLGGSTRPHVHQLLANTAAVRNNIAGSLRLLNLAEQAEAAQSLDPDGVGAWDVIPLVVTVHVEIAAFVHQPRVGMVSVYHLAQLLRGSPPHRAGGILGGQHSRSALPMWTYQPPVECSQWGQCR